MRIEPRGNAARAASVTTRWTSFAPPSRRRPPSRGPPRVPRHRRPAPRPGFDARGERRAREFFRDVWGDVPKLARAVKETLRASSARGSGTATSPFDHARLLGPTRTTSTTTTTRGRCSTARGPPLGHTLCLSASARARDVAREPRCWDKAYDASEFLEDRPWTSHFFGDKTYKGGFTRLRNLQFTGFTGLTRLRFAERHRCRRVRELAREDSDASSRPTTPTTTASTVTANVGQARLVRDPSIAVVVPARGTSTPRRGLVDAPRNARETRDVFDAGSVLDVCSIRGTPST